MILFDIGTSYDINSGLRRMRSHKSRSKPSVVDEVDVSEANVV